MFTQPARAGGVLDESEDRKKEQVHERAGRNAPEHGPGAGRRTNESDSAERPKNDPIRLSAHLAAGEGVPEFVHRHEDKQTEVKKRRPNRGGKMERHICTS